MVTKPLKIDELKKIFTTSFRKLDKSKYAQKCTDELECCTPVFKDAVFSEISKANGNKLYGQKDLDFAKLYKVLTLFNESIALAPKGSKELATAYANKSAVLLRMRKYMDCISEIDKVLKITESTTLKIKMLCRKAECLTALGSADNRSCLEKAKFIMIKLEDSEKEKSSLIKLMEKTQAILDKGKLDIPKEDKRKSQVLNMIAEVEKEDVRESIKIDYSEKYGQYFLRAACDFEPGVLILVDKSYFNNLDELRLYQYCAYCFNHLWTIVPCDYCCQRLYCSEQCKTQAWNEFHEIDCFAIPWMKVAFESSHWDLHMPYLIGVFCKALKEAGSIEQLVADSEALNEPRDQRSKSDLLIENFSNYKGIFTLPIINIQQDHLKTCTERATCALVGLAKYTKILDRSYDFKEMKDLMKDDKAMLVGAMLLKIFLLLTCSSPSVRLIDPTEQDVGIKDKGDSNDSYNHLICLMTAHTLSGCMTNVDSFYTYGNKTALCAIRPIKTGEKLILNAKSEAIWYNKTKSARQSSHRRAYGFSCKCQACTENWSNVLDNVNKLTNQLVAEMHCASTVKLWNENNAIALDWKNNRNKPSYPDANIVLRAIGLAKTSWKGLSMPSTIIVRSVLLLIKILRIFYNPSEIYSKMPQLREEEIANIFNPSDFCFCKEHSLEPLKPK